MGQGNIRNTPCWCGSGRKFKNCHLNRETQERVPKNEAVQAAKDLRGEELCLHPGSELSACSGPIVKAHTVQRSGGLSRIARSGHVYAISSDWGDLDRNQGRVVPKLVGVNKASTFTGFCKVHDSRLFAPLETKPFQPTNEQLFLLAFRALARELYGKRAQLKAMSLVREGDRGLPLHIQRQFQEMLSAHIDGIKLGLGTLTHHKSRFDDVFRNGSWDKLHSHVVELDRPPDVLARGFLFPEHDFDGRVVQSLLRPEEPHALAVSSIATDRGGAVVLSWMVEDEDSRRFVDSLTKIADTEVPHALVRFLFECFENIFFSPSWWDALPSGVQETLTVRINSGSSMASQIPASHLMDDGIRAVSWSVKGRSLYPNASS